MSALNNYIIHHPLQSVFFLCITFVMLLIPFFFKTNKRNYWIGFGIFLSFLLFIIMVSEFNSSDINKEEYTNQENLELSSSDDNGINTFGLDVSQYQGNILWDSVEISEHAIQFVFIRSTYGANKLDPKFKQNWKGSSKRKFLHGVYHYYRPNQNSLLQFEFFKRHVILSKGDLPPVLDIEENSRFGKDNLLKGIKNWLQLAENHYGVVPIIYTNRDFYLRYFTSKEFERYHFWIAAYSGRSRISNLPWTFFQFTEKMKVKGIVGNVDGNDFNGKREALEELTIK